MLWIPMRIANRIPRILQYFKKCNINSDFRKTNVEWHRFLPYHKNEFGNVYTSRGVVSQSCGAKLEGLVSF